MGNKSPDKGPGPIEKTTKAGAGSKKTTKRTTRKFRFPGGVCPTCGKPLEDTIRLDGLAAIVEFTGIPQSTFYKNGYMDRLLRSGYVFSRPGSIYNQRVFWSYKPLITAWLVENFSHFEGQGRRKKLKENN